jgi:hypothetical protein
MAAPFDLYPSHLYQTGPSKVSLYRQWEFHNPGRKTQKKKKQNKTKQNKRKKTKQNKTKQNKTT